MSEDLAKALKEIEQLKNKLEASEKRVNNANAIAASMVDKVKDIEITVNEVNEKFKNQTKIISTIKDEIKKNGGTASASGSSIDEEAAIEIFVRNIPFPQIKTYIHKEVEAFLGVIEKKKAVKPEKKKGSFLKFITIVLFVGSLLVGGYRYYDANKLTTRIIPKDTYYLASNESGYRKLMKDMTMLGKFKDIQTKQGIKRFFVSTKVIKGKEVEFKFLVERKKGKK